MLHVKVLNTQESYSLIDIELLHIKELKLKNMEKVDNNLQKKTPVFESQMRKNKEK